MADLAAGKPLAPVVRNASDGAAEALYGLGGAGTRQGDELAALIYLRLALFLRPDHDLAAVTRRQPVRGHQAQRRGDPRLSSSCRPLRRCAKAPKFRPRLELESIGRADDAMKRLSEIVAANPKDSDAWSAFGSLQRTAKKYEDAAASYDKAIELVGTPDRSNWTLFYFRGICFERAKQWPKAEADFKKALELYPDQPLVLNYLGYSWVDQGVNLDEAFKMLRRAVDLRPSDGYIVDSLGWAHYKLGHYAGGDRGAGKGDRPQAGRSRRQRSSRRRLLAGRPQDRGALPVEPRARHGARAGRPSRTSSKKIESGLPDEPSQGRARRDAAPTRPQEPAARIAARRRLVAGSGGRPPRST